MKTVIMTKKKLPRLPYRKAAEEVLGKNYELDLILASPSFMKKIYQTYKKRPRSTNVLAFPLSSETGEILLEPRYIEKEALSFSRTFKEHLWKMYLHGLLHLAGYDHEKSAYEAKKMFREETRLYKKISI